MKDTLLSVIVLSVVQTGCVKEVYPIKIETTFQPIQQQLTSAISVKLNTHSSLRYFSYSGKARISGEVFFSVIDNEDPSLQVYVNAIKIICTKGEFNVNGYDLTDTIFPTAHISVRKGEVLVVDTNDTLVLREGQTAGLDWAGINPFIHWPPANDALTWVDGYYHYENIYMRKFAELIKRLYQVEMTFGGHIQEEFMYLDKLQPEKSLSSQLAELEETTSFRFTLNADQTILHVEEK